MSDILKVEDLKKSYQKGFFPQRVEALRGVSFEVKQGRITGFIGANGAGKTTTLRCLLNFTRPDAGSFSFFGKPGLSMKVRGKIGYLPEHPHFYTFLTGLEFLNFYAQLSKVKVNRDDLMQALHRVKLEKAANRSLSGYSKGMLQRVGLAQALIHQPELLILDEPMSGLDPDGRRLVREILHEVAQKGVSLFFSTHLLDDAENLCQDLVLMSEGKVMYCGSLEGALASEEDRHVVRYLSQKGVPETREFFERRDMNAEILKIIQGGGELIEAKIQRRRLDDVFAHLARKSSRGQQ